MQKAPEPATTHQEEHKKTATLGVLLFFFCDTAIPYFWHKILHLLFDRRQNSTWNRVKGTAEELIVIRHHHGPRSISRKSWGNGLIMRLIDEQWCAQPQLNMFIQSSNVLRQTEVSHGFAVDCPNKAWSLPCRQLQEHGPLIRLLGLSDL